MNNNFSPLFLDRHRPPLMVGPTLLSFSTDQSTYAQFFQHLNSQLNIDSIEIAGELILGKVLAILYFIIYTL